MYKLLFGSFYNSDNNKDLLSINVKHSVTLADINIFWLNLFRKSLNIRLDKQIETPIIIPLSLDFTYQDHIILCETENHNIDLNFFEKLCLKKAFIFSKNDAQKDNYKLILEEYRDTIVQAIKNDNQRNFNEFMPKLQELIIYILKSGELTNVDNPDNYSKIFASEFWGGTLIEEICRDIYGDIFEASAFSVGDNNSYYFKKSCRNTHEIINESCKLPSLAGADVFLKYYVSLWYRLNDWWVSECNQKGITLGIEQRVSITGRNQDAYIEAIEKFIETSDYIQSVNLNQLKKSRIWDKDVLDLYRIHLRTIFESLLNAVRDGNEYAAIDLAEHLIRWNSNLRSDYSAEFDYPLNYASHLRLNTLALDKKLENLQAFFIEDHWLKDFDTQSFFNAILKKLYQDYLYVFSSFLINLLISNNIANLDKTVGFEILKKLLLGETDESQGSLNDIAKPLENIAGFWESFFRIFVYEIYDDTGFESEIYSFTKLLDERIKPPMKAGRTYSGFYEDKTQLSRFILCSLLKEKTPNALKEQLNHYAEFFLSELEDYRNLKISLVSEIERIEKLNEAENYQNHLCLFKEFQEVLGEFKLLESEEIPQKAEELFAERLNQTKEILINFLDKINEKEFIRYLDSSISSLRLKYIAKIISSIVTSQNNIFPLNKCELKFSNEDDNHFKDIQLNINKFSTSEVIENSPRPSFLGPSYFGNTFHRLIKDNLLYELINQIKTEHKVSYVSTENEIIDLLSSSIKSLKDAGYKPLIICSSVAVNPFLKKWQRSFYIDKSSLPREISFEKNNHLDGDEDGRMYEFDGCPVFISNIAENSFYIFPDNIFKNIVFLNYSENLPVNVTFEKDQSNPREGKLSIKWKFKLELNNLHNEVYIIDYSPIM